MFDVSMRGLAELFLYFRGSLMFLRAFIGASVSAYRLLVVVALGLALPIASTNAQSQDILTKQDVTERTSKQDQMRRWHWNRSR